MPAMTLGMAVSTLACQNLGAGHHDRVKQVFKWGCLLSAGITFFVSFAAVVFPQALLRLFVREAPVIGIGTS